MRDERVCDLRQGCKCIAPGVNGGFHWRRDPDACDHYHMPCPGIVRSKQDRVGATRAAWDRRRDKMMREAERRLDKLKPQGEVEDKLREIRHNPIKHLERKGVKNIARKPR